jgi:hypothetical protein
MNKGMAQWQDSVSIAQKPVLLLKEKEFIEQMSYYKLLKREELFLFF